MSSQADQGTPGTLLIVEDDEANREALCELLRDEGYAVAAAQNGQEALDYLHGLPDDAPLPRLIILDLMMPIMNGWQFREQMLRDPRLYRIPVLLMSAGAKIDEEAAAIAAAAVISKPPNIGDLLRLVEEHCRPRPA